MPDAVWRHFAYIISFNPNLMPWQVDVISPLLLVIQVRHRELFIIKQKQKGKWQRKFKLRCVWF